MDRLIGKAYLSPEAGVTSSEAPESETETVIKIGEKEFTQDEFQALLDSDSAGAIKVNIGDGKTATLKTLREAARREPDVQTLLKTEREKLEAERAAWKEEQKTEREKLLKEVGEASAGQTTKFADAIRDALGDGSSKDPFATKAEATAYITKLLVDERDGVGAVSAVLGKYFELKDATTAQMKEMADKFAAKMTEMEKTRADSEVDAFMRQEVKSIQRMFPNFNPDGDDEFSVLTTRLLTKATPSPILDNKVGKEMDAVDVAKMVEAHLDKGADARVLAKSKAKEEKEKSDVSEVKDRGSNAVLDDDLQKELDAAGVDKDKINAVLQKWSQRQQRKKK